MSRRLTRRQDRIESRLQELINNLTLRRSPQLPGPNSPIEGQGETENMDRQVQNTRFSAGILNILPMFEGREDEDVKFFLKQFKNVAEMVQLAPEQRAIVIGSRLRGAAREWLQANQRLHNEKDFDKIEKALIQYFEETPTSTQQQANFQKIRQKPGTKIRQLAQTLRNAAFKYLHSSEDLSGDADKITDKVLLWKFVESLKRNVQIEVMKCSPKTFEEAVQVAERMEAALSDVGATDEINNIQAVEQDNLRAAQELQIELLTAEVNNLKLRQSDRYGYDDEIGRRRDRSPERRNRDHDQAPQILRRLWKEGPPDDKLFFCTKFHSTNG